MRVLVIGGGIVGLTIIRELLVRGVEDIVLFEKGRPEKKASFAAAGMLAPQAESDSNDTFFRFCTDARDFYPAFAEEIENDSGIEVELDSTGTIYAAFDESDEHELFNRYEWQKAAGYKVEYLSAHDTHKLEPFISPESTGSLYFPNDWQVENRKVLRALKRIVEKAGVDIRESTEIKSLRFRGDAVCGVNTSTGIEIDADLIILATGAWTSLIETDRKSDFIPAIKPVRGQMVSYHTAKRLLSHVIYSSQGYLVPRRDGRILAGSTTEYAGFENTVTEDGIRSIKKTAVEIVPSLLNLAITEKWSGLRPCSYDGLPLIGRIPGCGNLIVSTGHYRNGILLAPFSAHLLVDSIINKTDSIYLDEFAPSRENAAAAMG